MLRHKTDSAPIIARPGGGAVHTAGLDLGLTLNNSHLVVCQYYREPTGRTLPQNVQVAKDEWDSEIQTVTVPELQDVFVLRAAFKFPLNTPYREVIDDVAAALQKPPLKGTTLLRFDGTGVGKAVADYVYYYNRRKTFGKYRAYGITAHGGQNSTATSVSKVDLLTNLQGIVESGRLRIPRKAQGGKELARQLEGMREKLTAARNMTYTSDTDEDGVDALALATWPIGLAALKPPVVQDDSKIPAPGSAESYELLRRLRREEKRDVKYRRGVVWL